MRTTFLFLLLFVFSAFGAGSLCLDLFRLKPIEASLLLAEYRKGAANSTAVVSKKLFFTGIGGRDVYNPTKPFRIPFHGKTVEVLAGRVEARDTESSEVHFFTEQDGVWSPLAGAPVFLKTQDPFFTFIGGEIIFGGVKTFLLANGKSSYKTVFYKGRALEDLRPQANPFAQGPNGMKDIRLLELSTGKIALFTRPQGINAGVDSGPGRIGFRLIHSLAELTPEIILSAPLLENQFTLKEWGGVNEAQQLSNGKIAVLAHIARFDTEGNRHYYSAVFTLDAATNKASPLKIILERGDLSLGLKGDSKRPDLVDVVFSGGLIIKNQSATLYVGAGDAEVYQVEIEKPF
jgi:hypothetical protein